MEEFRKIKLISKTDRTVTIAEDADDFVLDQDGLDLGSVGGTHNMTQFIDLIGKHWDSTVLNPRDISIIGWIIGPDLDTIKKRKTVLNQVVNPMYDLIIEYGTYALDVRPDSSIQYSKEWDYNNGYMCKFQIQCTAPMPLFRLKDYIEYRQTAEMTPKFKFPFSIPKNKGVVFAVLSYESLEHMPNSGDVASGFILYLTIDEGFEEDVINPIITNSTTGAIIRLNFTIKPNDKIILCTQLGNQYVKLIRNGEESNIIKYLSIESDIDMVLALGENTIKLDADENGVALRGRIEFSPRFLEVEGRE